MVNQLAFADDLIICAQTHAGLVSLFGLLKDGLTAVGLIINAKKTAIFSIRGDGPWYDVSSTKV